MGWTVTFEAVGDTPANLEQGLDEFVDLLVERGGAVSGSTRGDRYGASFSVPGPVDNATTAVALGYEIFTTYAEKSGLPAWPVVRAEALTFEELDRDLETPNFPELVGVSEVAQLLGVSRQRASQLAKTSGFPAPVANLASGPVWTRDSLNRFIEDWPRKEGRPPKLRTLARELIRKINDQSLAITPETAGILATPDDVIAERPYHVLVSLAQALDRERARLWTEQRPAENIAVVEHWLDETARTMSGYSANSE